MSIDFKNATLQVIEKSKRLDAEELIGKCFEQEYNWNWGDAEKTLAVNFCKKAKNLR